MEISEASWPAEPGSVKPRPVESRQDESGELGERSGFASYGWLLLIMGIALGLRLAFLSKESLWLDEVESWWFASDLGRAMAGESTNPPLYYTMLHFWIGWFGTSEPGLRSLSVVPGVLSVGLIYALARRLFSRVVALGAALYLSISSFQIYYSQEARTFAWLVFFILAAALWLWNALEERPSKRRFLYFSGYALFSALALYAHFITVFFLAGFGLFVLLRRRKQLLPFIAGSTTAVLLFLPWMLTLLRVAGGGGQQYRRYLVLKLPQAYFSFLFGDTLIPLDGDAVNHIRTTLLHFAPLLLAATLSVTILLPFVWRAWKRWGDRLEYALVAAVAPVLLAFLVSFKVMVFDERYLIAAAPFLYIVVAAAIVELLQWRKGHVAIWQSWASLAAVGLYSTLLLASLYNYFFSPRFGREQWRDAVAYVEAQDVGKTFIVFDPRWLHRCYDYYQKQGLPYGTVNDISDRTKLAGYDSIWFVQSDADSKVAPDVFGAQYKRASYRVFPKGGGIDVSLFRADSPVRKP
jgi:mannosyltransferase